ncbi:TetR/AcrR family transcriptional regulator [Fodinicola acaciae]|uniref:TetR/AcrR family transcriptional regulator n=1 Tax=Fodinicola acaciae TaxID=2681555 RepID=UPI001C9E97AD|nr:TetR/AcrR family transcriptional regulator [Fodinicola acaciae]
MRADARRNRALVLEAAEATFAEHGVAASMEQIARHAGVGVGTIYRHFPTKEALYEAIIVDRYERMAAEAADLLTAADAGEAFFAFFSRMVAESAGKKAFADSLGRHDLKTATADVGKRLLTAFQALLTRAQEAGAVRTDVQPAEVVAALTGLCMGAEQGSWDADLQARTLAITFAGLRT